MNLGSFNCIDPLDAHKCCGGMMGMGGDSLLEDTQGLMIGTGKPGSRLYVGDSVP